MAAGGQLCNTYIECTFCSVRYLCPRELQSPSLHCAATQVRLKLLYSRCPNEDTEFRVQCLMNLLEFFLLV